MTDHLPECFALMCECDDMHFKSIDCDFSCICSSLRACEQRVNSSNLTMWNHTQQQAQHIINSGLGIAWKDGFKEGLDAAREAILHDECCLSNLDDADERDCDCTRPYAVAAIDALREKP